MSTLSRVTPFQTLKLGSQVHTSQGDCILQTRTWGHTSTDFMVNTLPTPWNWNHRSTVSRLTSYLRPCLWVHKSTVSRVTPPPRYCTQGLMWHPFQTLNLESHVLSLWGDNTSQCLHLRSNFHSLQGYPLPDPVAADTYPQSQVWPHTPDPFPEVTYPVSVVKHFHRPCTWGNTSTATRVTPLSRPVPGVTYPLSQRWHPSLHPVPVITCSVSRVTQPPRLHT